MSLEVFRAQLQLAAYVAQSNTADITHEESLLRVLGDDGSSMNWVLGHVVAIRSRLLPALGQEPVWSSEQQRPYTRGSAPGPDIYPFHEIRIAFDESQKRFLAGLESLTPQKLAAPMPGPNGEPAPLANLIATIVVHDSYHLGQTGILRRLAGKPGAVK
ncbi:MAG TPA: DinB family protein [Thermoanaerobaculia bacterium]|jgi:uncharacterized damage-inducible protein DinB